MSEFPGDGLTQPLEGAKEAAAAEGATSPEVGRDEWVARHSERRIARGGRIGVIEQRLRDRPFLAGDYSIADMAAFPWVVPHERQGQKLEDFPRLKRWFETLRARPAVTKGLDLGKDRVAQTMSDAAKKILFGQTAANVLKN